MKFLQKFKRGDFDWKAFVKRPPVMAGLILLAIAVWILSGVIGGGNHANSSTQADKAPGADLFTVRAERMEASEYVETVRVRGRTEALMTVELKAEEEGRVIATPVEKGQFVKKGQTICEIEPYAREAVLAQARALAAQRELEYNASLALEEKGFRSPTQVASDKAEHDAALALVRQAEVSLGKTKLRAPFDGLVNDRAVEIGDFLNVGSTCAVVLTGDPYLVVGEVSDRQVGRIAPGTEVTVELTTGGTLAGKIRYISSAARLETRTFRVEVVVPNADLALRDGMTADILIPAATVRAYFLPSSVLVLKDDGSVGVRVVEAGDKVAFYPVEIAGTMPDGIWVRGLPDRITLIVSGQGFVREGEQVKTAFADAEPQS